MVDLIKENVSLKPYNSWKVGGEAKYFSQPANKSQLKEAYAWALENSIEVCVIGGGSNVLLSDKGFNGLIIQTSKFTGLDNENLEDGFISFSTLSGTPKAEALKVFLKYKSMAAIFLTGLPGDIAGGVVMNAGVGTDTKPKEFTEIVDWVEVLKSDLTFKTYKHSDLEWVYRKTKGWQPGIVTEVGFKYKHEPIGEIGKLMREATKRRIRTQPINKPSGGSTFKNPDGYKSGALIDGLGLKGFTIGGATVSEKHANFLVTDETGTAQDLLDLVRYIQGKVKEAHGVSLETEVQLVGEFD